MLRFTKETDYERVKRLRKSIIDDYIESDSTTSLMISEADLRFMLEKAEEQVGFELETPDQIEELHTTNDEPRVEIAPVPNNFDNTSGDGGELF